MTRVEFSTANRIVRHRGWEFGKTVDDIAPGRRLCQPRLAESAIANNHHEPSTRRNLLPSLQIMDSPDTKVPLQSRRNPPSDSRRRPSRTRPTLPLATLALSPFVTSPPSRSQCECGWLDPRFPVSEVLGLVLSFLLLKTWHWLPPAAGVTGIWSARGRSCFSVRPSR